MRWFSVVCFAFIVGTAQVGSAATSPDQSYIEYYNLILEGDDLRQSGNAAAARNRYLEAQKGLTDLQTRAPSWNKAIVEYRLKYLNERLGDLPAAPAETKPAARSNDPRDVQIQRLNQEVITLNEKLKEALAIQPAAVDPRELARTEEKLKTVQKERDLLEVSLKQERSKKAADPAQLEAARKELEELKGELARQVETRQRLAKDLETARSANDSGKAENALQKQVQSLQEELRKKELVLSAAQNDLKRAEASAPKSDDKGSAKKIANLEKDRAALEKQVAELKQDLKKKNSKSGGDASTEVASLRARVEALSAEKLPYTPEELALMKAPSVAIVANSNVAAPTAVKRSGPTVPAGAGGLVREAQQAFAARRFADAEEKYTQVLKLDENNVYTLANLAAVQLEANKITEAESNLKKAIAADPDDAYSHMLHGILSFRQDKFDDALTHLSRAVQLDPNSAEAQNYLGITLSQKGQRGPAEAALRKAISISPNNPGAHHNLAVIYATQKPAFPQLAKHHYQKALTAGHPKNPDLEKLMDPAAQK